MLFSLCLFDKLIGKKPTHFKDKLIGSWNLTITNSIDNETKLLDFSLVETIPNSNIYTTRISSKTGDINSYFKGRFELAFNNYTEHKVSLKHISGNDETNYGDYVLSDTQSSGYLDDGTAFAFSIINQDIIEVTLFSLDTKVTTMLTFIRPDASIRNTHPMVLLAPTFAAILLFLMCNNILATDKALRKEEEEAKKAEKETKKQKKKKH